MRVEWDHTGTMRIHKHFLMTWTTTRWSRQCAGFHAVYVIKWKGNHRMAQSVEQISGTLNSWRVIYSINISCLCAVFVWKEGRLNAYVWLLVWLLVTKAFFFFYGLHEDLTSFVCVIQVFICEQKLYTRSQLNQHISTGNTEVDGSESERGGFTGHPMCEFCRTPFYGENELYSHMSTEHYTCHICQR